MHHNLIIKDGDATKVEKQILVDGIQFVDSSPIPGSLNPVTSGGVAEGITEVSSNIAPEYTKKTYEANSYVMHNDILYTNENAIDTAEDWNPAHWTQTTVAQMMSGSGAKWTKRTVELTINGGTTQEIDIQDHELVDLTVRKGSGSSYGQLKVHLYGECYVHLNKGEYVKVTTYLGDSTTSPTTDINSGEPKLETDEVSVLGPDGSGMPSEYDPDSFIHYYAISSVSFTMFKPSLDSIFFVYALLHSLGNGTLIITPLPN